MPKGRGEPRPPTAEERVLRQTIRAVMEDAKKKAPAVIGADGKMIASRGTAPALIEQLYAAGIRPREKDRETGLWKDRYSEPAVSRWIHDEAPSPPPADVFLAAVMANGLRLDQRLYGQSMEEKIDKVVDGLKALASRVERLEPSD